MDTKTLISDAKEAVSSASYCPKKLTALHTGIAAAASLLVALLTYLLSTGIGGTGGLGGIGTRAALETAQSILSLAVNILSPFWALGFVAVAMGLARRQAVGNPTLLAGFRIWWPALRLTALEGLLFLIVIVVTMQIGTYLYLLSPLSEAATTLIQQIAAVNPTDSAALLELTATLDQQTINTIAWSALPFMVIPPLVVLIPLSYRLRLAEFILMDQPQGGAMYAVFLSFRLMKKNCLKLFLLDLRFWWFYALEVLVQVLCYGDVLLPLVGVTLDMNGVLASFLFYALALGCQVGLYVWKKPQIYASYALFYDRLLPQEQPQEM